MKKFRFETAVGIGGVSAFFLMFLATVAFVLMVDFIPPPGDAEASYRTWNRMHNQPFGTGTGTKSLKYDGTIFNRPAMFVRVQVNGTAATDTCRVWVTLANGTERIFFLSPGTGSSTPFVWPIYAAVDSVHVKHYNNAAGNVTAYAVR